MAYNNCDAAKTNLNYTSRFSTVFDKSDHLNYEYRVDY